MTEQHEQQLAQESTALGLSPEDLEAERKELDWAWAEFSRVRASVAEAMSDDDLRVLGINVEALDARP